MTDSNSQQAQQTSAKQQNELLDTVNTNDISEQAPIDEHDNIGVRGAYGTPSSESGVTDQDPYANLDGEDLYSNHIADPYQGKQDLYDDVSLYDDQDPQHPQNTQHMQSDNDQSEFNDPDTDDESDQTAGGEGLYGEAEDLASNNTMLPVHPGSDQDQYGTRGSQDQYGYQQ